MESMRLARRAGSQLASRATPASSTATPANVPMGSRYFPDVKLGALTKGALSK